jgi:hypothetical protein
MIVFLLATHGLWAEGSDQPGTAEIAKMMKNPLSYLWMFATQNDTYWIDGDLKGADKVHVNTFTIMPVMPMQLTENYKLVVRPWLPVVSVDMPRNRNDFEVADPNGGIRIDNIAVGDTSWKSGIGDVGFWAAVASNENAKPPYIFGAGITARFDTASRREFGSGRTSAGPMALAFYVGEEWTLGGIVQHWWDFAGDDDRKHVNKTSFQYFYYYNLTPETSIGASPSASYDWIEDRYDFPVGLGLNTTVKIGKLPVGLSASLYYHTGNNDRIHNRWQLQIGITPILPSPVWSRKPLFD